MLSGLLKLLVPVEKLHLDANETLRANAKT
jgi:hypothetical protein